MEGLEVQKPNYSGLVLIGAGLPRTGTTSTRKALSTLLDGACYHMTDVFIDAHDDPTFWESALDEKVDEMGFKEFLNGNGYRAGLDYPFSLFYKDIMKVYPEAKILLTVRNPETWYTSVKESIYVHTKMWGDWVVRAFARLIGKYEMMRIVGRVCHETPKGFSNSMFGSIADGPEASVKFFNEWEADVRQHVPADQLLVFSVKEGWEPLCKFLDVPVPDEPFPRVNDTAEVQARFKNVTRASYAVVFGAPVVMSAVAYCLGNWAVNML